ncbi:MAG: PilN domain-containing protein [Calditrichia bacterium]
MDSDQKYSGKLAVGIFVEDTLLHIVCLAREDKKTRLVEAEILQMDGVAEEVAIEQEVLADGTAANDTPFEFADGNAASSLLDSGGDLSLAALAGVLNRFPDKKYKLALSLPEPLVYYTTFDSDWGLKGTKLKKKIVEEITASRSEGQELKPESIHVLPMAGSRILAIVNDDDSNVMEIHSALRSNAMKRTPMIDFVETAEVSLVNLINHNYEFNEDEISLVIYVGSETSRLIFMHGKQIYNVSNLIGAGLDSANVANTIYSRLLLEQDNLNLHKMDNIILTGEAFEAELKEFLVSKLDEDVNIEYLKFNSLEVSGIDPLLSRFSIAIGAALRSLDKFDGVYDIDLIPKAIREGQKSFKLGPVGWTLLALIPILTFLFTIQVVDQQESLNIINSQIATTRADIDSRNNVEPVYNAEKKKLADFDRTLGLVDSLLIGAKVWSSVLHKISRSTAKVKGVWVTDVVQSSKTQLRVEGYSLYRDRVSQFANSLEHNSNLSEVELEKIQDKEVYSFIVKLDIPKK